MGAPPSRSCLNQINPFRGPVWIDQRHLVAMWQNATMWPTGDPPISGPPSLQTPGVVAAVLMVSGLKRLTRLQTFSSSLKGSVRPDPGLKKGGLHFSQHANSVSVLAV